MVRRRNLLRLINRVKDKNNISNYENPWQFKVESGFNQCEEFV